MGCSADEQGNPIESEYDRRRELQRLTIVYGIPECDFDHKSSQQTCSLRGRVWKALLGVTPSMINVSKYTEIVQQGPSFFDADIRNDTFRYSYFISYILKASN